jgi:hypothetical protein
MFRMNTINIRGALLKILPVENLRMVLSSRQDAIIRGRLERNRAKDISLWAENQDAGLASI